MSYVKLFMSTLVCGLLWGVFSVFGGLSGWWLESIAPPEQTDEFYKKVVEIVKEENVGNISIQLIERGKLHKQYFSSTEQSIDENTLYPTASLSKWITAFSIMTLVDNGKIDLDKPVSAYLKRWNIPKGVYNSEEVTVRHLLSHMSGLSDGLGFGDYLPEETVPTLLDTLEDPLASGGRKAVIALGTHAGKEWNYSGGGYLILELLIEDVTGIDFSEYVDSAIFKPNNMERSTYEYIGNLQNSSYSYDISGDRAPTYKYAARGATGLSTTITDLAKLTQNQVSNNSIFSMLAKSMREPHASMWGAEIWGLGTILYAPTKNGSFVYGHDGSNEPAINSTVRINPENGDAIIVLSNGGANLASKLGYHWTLWQTGYPDLFSIDRAVESSFVPFVVGFLLIFIAFILKRFFRNRAKKNGGEMYFGT